MNRSAPERKSFLVDRSLQLRLLWFNLSFVLFPALLIGMYAARVFKDTLSHPETLGMTTDHAFYKAVVEDMRGLLAMAGVSLVLASFFAVLASVVLSHRIAGPIYRLKKFLREYNAASPTELKFRPKDEFKDLANAMNEFLKGR